MRHYFLFTTICLFYRCLQWWFGQIRLVRYFRLRYIWFLHLLSCSGRGWLPYLKILLRLIQTLITSLPNKVIILSFELLVKYFLLMPISLNYPSPYLFKCKLILQTLHSRLLIFHLVLKIMPILNCLSIIDVVEHQV